MNKVRRSAWQAPFVAVALLGAALNAVGSTGCGDDDDDVSGSGGASGSGANNKGSGGGGGSTTGGSGGVSGTGGAGGSAMGAGGSSGAGAGGSGAGAGGSAGSGAGGDAGGGGSAGGGSGQGGTGGSGPGFCASKGKFAFCSDFDGENPITPGGDGWDSVEPKASTLELATNQSASAPSSVHFASTEGERPSLMKTFVPLAPFQVADATFEYDVYIDTLPSQDGAGFGLSDFQFFDGGGSDLLGFRLVVKANADGSLKELHFEHNCPGQDYFDKLLEGVTIPLKTWTHVRIEAFFDEGSNQRAARLYLGGSETPAFDNTEAPFPPFIGTAPFARVRLIPFDFGKGYSVYYDNVLLTANVTSPGAQRPPVARKGR